MGPTELLVGELVLCSGDDWEGGRVGVEVEVVVLGVEEGVSYVGGAMGNVTDKVMEVMAQTSAVMLNALDSPLLPILSNAIM